MQQASLWPQVAGIVDILAVCDCDPRVLDDTELECTRRWTLLRQVLEAKGWLGAGAKTARWMLDGMETRRAY